MYNITITSIKDQYSIVPVVYTTYRYNSHGKINNVIAQDANNLGHLIKFLLSQNSL